MLTKPISYQVETKKNWYTENKHNKAKNKDKKKKIFESSINNQQKTQKLTNPYAQFFFFSFFFFDNQSQHILRPGQNQFIFLKHMRYKLPK